MNNVKKYEMSLIRSRALTVLFSLILSALILLPLFTSAKGKNTPDNTKVFMQPLKKDLHAAVTIASLSEGKYTLTIESAYDSYVYYNETLDNSEFAKIFDFSNLEDGSYTLKIKAGNRVNYRYFDIYKGEIKVHYDEKNQPQFSTRGKKAMIEMPNESNIQYAIKILDEKGNELFSATDDRDKIRKVFDFSNLEKGNYQVLVSSNRQTFAFDYQKED